MTVSSDSSFSSLSSSSSSDSSIVNTNTTNPWDSYFPSDSNLLPPEPGECKYCAMPSTQPPESEAPCCWLSEKCPPEDDPSRPLTPEPAKKRWYGRHLSMALLLVQYKRRGISSRVVSRRKRVGQTSIMYIRLQ